MITNKKIKALKIRRAKVKNHKTLIAKNQKGHFKKIRILLKNSIFLMIVTT